VQALTRITSRTAKGSRIGADGVLVPEEVYQKAPDKILTITSYKDVVFTNGFNGKISWGHSSKTGPLPLPDQAMAQLKSDSVFYKELKTAELYSKLTLLGKIPIGNSEAYVIEANPINGSSEAANGLPEKLFFDVRTGLLLRRYTEMETILGKLPLQTDYEDYREIDGVKQPFLMHWSLPGRIWGRRVDEIKQNVALDDTKFNPPTQP
jgi:hypothetical protein